LLEFGYVRLYRSLLNGEWYTHAKTKSVFLHLILTANYEPKKWRGITVERGQRVYSSQKLADELHVSRQTIRTAISHLLSTGEITNQTTSKYSVITIKNYDSYQSATNQSPDIQPTSNQVPNQPTTNSLTNDSTNHQPSQNTHGSLEKCKSNISVQPANQPTKIQKSTNEQPQCNKAKEIKKLNNIYIGFFSEYAKDDGLLLSTLNDFAEMRKAKKKPLATERAVKMLLVELDKLSPESKTKIKILNQSILNSWSGVFPLKGEANGRFTNNVADHGKGAAGSAEEIPRYGKVY